MKIVAALDSFKGSVSSWEAGSAVSSGIRSVDPTAETAVFPLADGGEGTVEALASALSGTMITRTVTGPLGLPAEARYALLKNGTAVIEMAAAAGLPLVPKDRRDPMVTTTFGVGELIRDAIFRGCRHFIIGLGGSATNDGGIGMLAALGVRFTDEAGEPIPLCAGGLERLAAVDVSGLMPELRECFFRVASDVTNPLCGKLGCSRIFAPQKGGTADTIPRMDAALARYAALTKTVCPQADSEIPGAGAAGGLGFAFLAFLPSSLSPGVNIVMEETKLEDAIRTADLVITGEGRLDAQTAMGKAPAGVAALAKKYGKPVIALAGCVTEDAESLNEHGIDAFFPILRTVMTPEEAMDPENARRNLEKTAAQAFRLFRLSRF